MLEIRERDKAETERPGNARGLAVQAQGVGNSERGTRTEGGPGKH